MCRILYMFLLFIFFQPITLYSENQSFKNDSIRARRMYAHGIKMAEKNLYNNAIDSFIISLEINKKLFGEGRKTGYIQTALGINYKNIGQLDKAIQYFLAAENSYNSDDEPNKKYIASIYSNLGNVYKSKMNYGTALEYYERALYLIEAIPSSSSYIKSDIYYNLAVTYFKINEYSKSLSIIEQQIKKTDEFSELYLLDLKAVVYQVVGSFEKADNAYIEAINQAIKLYSDNDIEVAYEYLNYATFLGSTGMIDKALNVLQKAYDIIIQVEKGGGINIAEYYFIFGGIYANKKVESTDINEFKRQKSSNLTSAIDCYKKGLKALNFTNAVENTQTEPDLSRMFIIDAVS